MIDGSVHDNVTMGVVDLISRPEEVTREEVKKARQASMMYEFITDLPDGNDTRLGNGGASLSGGRKQAFVITCTILRDPTVLVLGRHTVVCGRSEG